MNTEQELEQRIAELIEQERNLYLEREELDIQLKKMRLARLLSEGTLTEYKWTVGPSHIDWGDTQWTHLEVYLEDDDDYTQGKALASFLFGEISHPRLLFLPGDIVLTYEDDGQINISGTVLGMIAFIQKTGIKVSFVQYSHVIEMLDKIKAAYQQLHEISV